MSSLGTAKKKKVDKVVDPKKLYKPYIVYIERKRKKHM